MHPGASGRVASVDVDSERSLSAGYDFARLERAVAALLRRQRALENDKAALVAELEASRRRVLDLDAQLVAANERRREILERIDPLLSELDALEAQIDGTTLSRPPAGAPERNAASAEGA